MNRRMPNGMYGGVRGERKSPLLDCSESGINKGFERDSRTYFMKCNEWGRREEELK